MKFTGGEDVHEARTLAGFRVINIPTLMELVLSWTVVE